MTTTAWNSTDFPRDDTDKSISSSTADVKSYDVSADTESLLLRLLVALSCRSREIAALRHEVGNRPHVYSLTIYDLGSPDYSLVYPLSIVIEEYGEDQSVIARCPELDTLGEGMTSITIAIQALRDSILDLYDELIETDVSTLGTLPLTWLRILKRIIVKTPA